MPDQYDELDPREDAINPKPAKPRRERPPLDDEFDDEDYGPGRKGRREEGDATGGLIPYKNPQALIGYYCGVFSLIPILGLVLGPAALVLGMLGLRYVNQHPTAKGTGHAVVALVLGGMSLVGHFACIALTVASMLASGKR